MKKALIIVVVSIFSITIQAQTFVCTDMNYYGSELTPQEVQKEKAKFLGSKATLTFYDKSVRLSITENGKVVSLVLDKINDNEYQYIEKKRTGDIKKAVIKLSKWAAYIRSFTLVGYKNSSMESLTTFRRD